MSGERSDVKEEPIRCTEEEMPMRWREAMWAHRPLIVMDVLGREETYHPPYMYSDSMQAALDRYPGMAVCLSTGPWWMVEAAMDFLDSAREEPRGDHGP